MALLPEYTMASSTLEPPLFPKFSATKTGDRNLPSWHRVTAGHVPHHGSYASSCSVTRCPTSRARTALQTFVLVRPEPATTPATSSLPPPTAVAPHDRSLQLSSAPACGPPLGFPALPILPSVAPFPAMCLSLQHPLIRWQTASIGKSSHGLQPNFPSNSDSLQHSEHAAHTSGQF